MRRIFLSAIFLLGPLCGFAHAAAQAIPDVVIGANLKTKAVRIAGSQDLVGPARTAFGVHGAFRVVDTGAAYTFTFTNVGGNQVRVDVAATSPAANILSQTVSGTSARNALFRAADLAVEKITGGRGFFAGKIAFVREVGGTREVCAADLFLGDARQITTDRSEAMHPRWSADGNRIVYTSFFRSGTPDVFLIDTRTSQRTDFARFKGTNAGARFSPDGSTSAVVLSPKGNADIYLGGPNGAPFRALTRTPAIEASPVFSPDGSRVLFTSDRAGRPQLCMLSVAGGTITPVATNLSGYCAEPDWSTAKPEKIAFTVAVGGSFQIAVYDLNTRQGKIITRNKGDGVEPCWLADGRHIIYTVRSAGVRRLAIVDAESEMQNGKSTTLNAPSLGNISSANYWKR